MGRLLVDTFKREHLDMFDKREEDTFIAELISSAASHIENSATIVLIDPEDMKVVFMGGIFQQWPGVGEVWMLASDKMSRFRKTSLVMIHGFMTVVIEQLKLHRLQCTVQKGFPRYQAFAEHFGFVNEGLMPKYGIHGEDHIRYGRIT